MVTIAGMFAKVDRTGQSEMNFVNHPNRSREIFSLLVDLNTKKITASRKANETVLNYPNQNGHFPFDNDELFYEISFAFEKSRVRVTVNGDHYHHYELKLPIDEINYIRLCDSFDVLYVSLSSEYLFHFKPSKRTFHFSNNKFPDPLISRQLQEIGHSKLPCAMKHSSVQNYVRIYSTKTSRQ